MTKEMKQELFNNVLTGLLIAATFALAVPMDALAQNLAAVGTQAGTNVATPFVKFAGYAAYAMGTVGVVNGISKLQAHAKNPSSNPIGPGLGYLGAGAGFLAAPSIGNMLVGTDSTLGINSSTTFQGFGSSVSQ